MRRNSVLSFLDKHHARLNPAAKERLSSYLHCLIYFRVKIRTLAKYGIQIIALGDWLHKNETPFPKLDMDHFSPIQRPCHLPLYTTTMNRISDYIPAFMAANFTLSFLDYKDYFPQSHHKAGDVVVVRIGEHVISEFSNNEESFKFCQKLPDDTWRVARVKFKREDCQFYFTDDGMFAFFNLNEEGDNNGLMYCTYDRFFAVYQVLPLRRGKAPLSAADFDSFEPVHFEYSGIWNPVDVDGVCLFGDYRAGEHDYPMAGLYKTYSVSIAQSKSTKQFFISLEVKALKKNMPDSEPEPVWKVACFTTNLQQVASRQFDDLTGEASFWVEDSKGTMFVGIAEGLLPGDSFTLLAYFQGRFVYVGSQSRSKQSRFRFPTSINGSDWVRLEKGRHINTPQEEHDGPDVAYTGDEADQQGTNPHPSDKITATDFTPSRFRLKLKY